MKDSSRWSNSKLTCHCVEEDSSCILELEVLSPGSSFWYLNELRCYISPCFMIFLWIWNWQIFHLPAYSFDVQRTFLPIDRKTENWLQSVDEYPTMHHFQFFRNIDRWLFRNHLYRWNFYSTLINHSDHQLLDLDVSSYTISWIVVQHREASTVLLPSAFKKYCIGKTLTSASCL